MWLEKFYLTPALCCDNHCAVKLLSDYLHELEGLLRCQSRERLVQNDSSICTSEGHDKLGQVPFSFIEVFHGHVETIGKME